MSQPETCGFKMTAGNCQKPKGHNGGHLWERSPKLAPPPAPQPDLDDPKTWEGIGETYDAPAAPSPAREHHGLIRSRNYLYCICGEAFRYSQGFNAHLRAETRKEIWEKWEEYRESPQWLKFFEWLREQAGKE